MYKIAVISHRGGSGKTALASGLSCALAEQGPAVLSIDLCKAGGSSILSGGGFRLGINPGQVTPQLPSVDVLRHDIRELETLWNICQEHERTHDLAIIDVPSAGRKELSELLRGVDLVLISIPSDANSLKSLHPFLEFLNEERSRPGRAFNVVAVLTRICIDNIIDKMVMAEAQRYLAPFLLQGVLMEDPSILQAMANGLALARGTISDPISAAFMNLAVQLEGIRSAHAQECLQT